MVPLPDEQRGVTDTFQAEASVFLKKAPATQPPYTVAVEYVCAELARMIRIPVPPSFVAELPGEEASPAFSTLGFNLTGGTTPPIDPAEAVAADADLATGIVVFDAWIFNSDRHRGNLSFQATRRPHRLNVFDHSHALLFYPDTLRKGVTRLGICGTTGGDRGNRHCLLDTLNTGQFFGKWLDRVQRVPEDLILEIVADAEELGLPSPLVRPTTDFLLIRQRSLRDLFDAHRAQLPLVTDWSFL